MSGIRVGTGSLAKHIGVSMIVLGGAGCARDARSVTAASPQSMSVDPRPPLQVLEPVLVRAHETEELLADLERARSLLLVEKFKEAAEALDRLRIQAGDPWLQATAAYHAGLAYEGLGDRELALERFRLVSDSFGDQASARLALVRLVRAYGRLERWTELDGAADRLLSRGDLSAMDQLEGRGAKALALVELGDSDAATKQVGKALEIIARYGFGTASAPPVQVAQVMFAEGEIRRLKSEGIRLVPLTPRFPELLEARCQALLDAQSAYTEAMRARDSHWSAMSGFRVGQLYTDLHAEAMTIPVPEKATTLKQKQLFEGALRLRYRALLEKGLKMMAATVRLGDRTGDDSEWIARARQSKRVLEQTLEEEKRALALLPYTEEELRKGLDSLQRKGNTAGGTPMKPTDGPHSERETKPRSPSGN